MIQEITMHAITNNSSHDQIMAALDPSNPDSIQNLLAFHHATFGDARMEAGGDGESGTENPSENAQPGQESGTETGQEPGGESNDEEQQDDATEWWKDPAKAKAEIDRLRRKQAAARKAPEVNEAKVKQEAEAEIVARLAEALGLSQDEATDPETLKAQATEAAREANATKVENAILRYAASAEADADALLDSRKFMARVEDIAPSADDFQQKITDAMKKIVAEDSRYKKAAPKKPAGASSVDGSQSGGSTPEKAPTLAEVFSDLYK